MFRFLCAVAVVFLSLSLCLSQAQAGGWSGGERDQIFAPFKRGFTLEGVYLRLGSRK